MIFMEGDEIEKVHLNNGVEMPVIGLGTFLMKPEEAEDAVYNALQVGYRLIDTANAYLNERASLWRRISICP